MVADHQGVRDQGGMTIPTENSINRVARTRMLGVLAQLAGPATFIRQAPAARCR
jgi:hypothetical protein